MPRFAFASPLALFCAACLVGLAARASADDAAATEKPAATPEQEAFFEKSIRPILATRCFECHGDKKQEGGLRLDSRSAMTKAGDTGPAVVPGNTEESRLLEVVSYKDAIKMPPKGKLADTEIASLTEWVKMGAPFPIAAEPSAGTTLGQYATPEGLEKARATFWALQPVTRPQPPSGDGEGWARTGIDRFVFEKLAAVELKPNPQADRRTLLRRVTFDLIGLPPTAEETAAFENDSSPNAFADVVDRLLASPHYGERWGRHWLDVARYADTKGYVFNEERKFPFSYTYRDYVVKAFNSDLPFNRFVVEQLAADQLELGDDKSPLAAMGFLTVGRRFSNKLPDVIDDRIDVVSRGLLGMTVACARCHDHKYDPIPTDDYYSLYGVFSNSVEPTDLPQIGPPADAEAFRAYEKELARLEGIVDKFVADKLKSLAEEFRAKAPDYLAAVVKFSGKDLPDERGTSIGTGEVRMPILAQWREYLSETAKAPHPVFGPWHALAQLPEEGFAETSAATIAGLSDAADALPRTNPLIKKALVEAAPKSMAEVAAAYGKLVAEINDQWLKHEKRLAEQAVATTEGAGSGQAAAEEPAKPGLEDPDAEEIRQVLYGAKSPARIDGDDTRRLFDRAVRDKISALKRNVDVHKANSSAAPPRAMVMNDSSRMSQPKVFIRGDARRPGKEVPRRFLQVLAPGEAGVFKKGSGRLELAEAIASPNNPLTARVLVNRVWLHHFGKALVGTPSDFGIRGAAPTHPELLDYLAGTFMDEGWSIKKLHRKILLSAVYQQSSDDRPDGLKVDSENRLLWKMNRQRLEFEPLRDSLLAVSGRLDRRAEGRPVELFSEPFSTRRAIYGFIDRQDLPGTFRIFDFASPDVSMPQRPQTTVPQQALYCMNSPFVIEQARSLAAGAVVASASGDAERVRALYRLVFSREADEAELAAGVRFLTESRAAAISNEDSARPEQPALPEEPETKGMKGKAKKAPPPTPLTVLEQYAQALLLANEFVFVD